MPDGTILVTFGRTGLTSNSAIAAMTIERFSGLLAVLPQLPQAPTRDFALSPGFNLAGWLGATPIEAATDSIAGQFDAIFTFDNATQSFRSFRPALPILNTLTELVRGEGVWIIVTDPDGVRWAQPTFDASREVTLGVQFNLVMWTGPDGTPVADAVAEIAGGLDALFTRDSTSQIFLSYRPAGPVFLNTAKFLDHGDGVWLKMTAAAIWTQPAGP